MFKYISLWFMQLFWRPNWIWRNLFDSKELLLLQNGGIFPKKECFYARMKQTRSNLLKCTKVDQISMHSSRGDHIFMHSSRTSDWEELQKISSSFDKLHRKIGPITFSKVFCDEKISFQGTFTVQWAPWKMRIFQCTIYHLLDQPVFDRE